MSLNLDKNDKNAVAIVSKFGDVITVHDVYEPDLDDQLLFTTISQRILGELFGDNLVVCAPDDVPVGKFTAITPEGLSMHLAICTAENVAVTGWTGTSYVRKSKFHGSITICPCNLHDNSTAIIDELRAKINHINAASDNSRGILESRIIALDEQINDLGAIVERLQNELAAARNELDVCSTQSAQRTAECVRAVRDNISLRAANDLNTSTIISLNDEIGRLRAGRDITTRFNYTTGINNVISDIVDKVSVSKESKPAIPDASYDNCINQLKSFDRSSLKRVKK